jgi:hypothetical protein
MDWNRKACEKQYTSEVVFSRFKKYGGHTVWQTLIYHYRCQQTAIIFHNQSMQGRSNIDQFLVQQPVMINLLKLSINSTVVFDFIHNKGAAHLLHSIAILFLSTPYSSKSFDIQKDRNNNATTRPGHQ